MTEDEFLEGLSRAKQGIDGLPADKQIALLRLFKEVVRRHAAMRENCQQARTGLDDLRIMLKYLIFDQEATRREQARGRGRQDE
jgi:hypothetical protein